MTIKKHLVFANARCFSFCVQLCPVTIAEDRDDLTVIRDAVDTHIG